jgi:hypothetical protein
LDEGREVESQRIAAALKVARLRRGERGGVRLLLMRVLPSNSAMATPTRWFQYAAALGGKAVMGTNHGCSGWLRAKSPLLHAWALVWDGGVQRLPLSSWRAVSVDVLREELLLGRSLNTNDRRSPGHLGFIVLGRIGLAA